MALLVFLLVAAALALALLALSYWAENGCLPDFLLLPSFGEAVALPAGPYYCDASRRWRDPVTKKFVAAPRR